jgi:hypothetical protein
VKSVAAVALALVSAAVPAAAPAPPTGPPSPPAAFAAARRGTLSVTSGVYVSAKAVELLGVWNDRRVACAARRRLAVKGEVNWTSFGGRTRRVVRRGVFLDANCAEGGPNVGFTIRARSVGLACANGRWKPGHYVFGTDTREPATRLRATADLLWEKRSC